MYLDHHEREEARVLISSVHQKWQSMIKKRTWCLLFLLSLGGALATLLLPVPHRKVLGIIVFIICFLSTICLDWIFRKLPSQSQEDTIKHWMQEIDDLDADDLDRETFQSLLTVSQRTQDFEVWEEALRPALKSPNLSRLTLIKTLEDLLLL